MNNSQIFLEAHQIAKTTLSKFANYRSAFSAALKNVYNTPKKVEFENYKTERITPALEAISNGGSWNGVIYGKKVRKGKETRLFVYVDGIEFYLATPYSQYVEEAKAEFMKAVNSRPVKPCIKKQDSRSIFGSASEGENDLSFRPSDLYHAEMSI